MFDDNLAKIYIERALIKAGLSDPEEFEVLNLNASSTDIITNVKFLDVPFHPSFSLVDDIHMNANGKVRFTVNLIPK